MTALTDHIKDMFASLGPIQTRKMFGGYGVFYEGMMFGLIADDVLYLKTDSETEPHFTERGLPAFEYQKKDKLVKLHYHQAPEDIFDDPEAATEWGLAAIQVAKRQANKR